MLCAIAEAAAGTGQGTDDPRRRRLRRPLLPARFPVLCPEKSISGHRNRAGRRIGVGIGGRGRAGGLDGVSGHQNRQRKDSYRYDVMQVCSNGHRITDSATSFPQHRKEFCAECGAKTIMGCPECQAPIQGRYSGAISARATPVPNNCQGCGTAFPWRQDAIASAIEILQMQLGEQDSAEITELVPAIAVETPKTHLAALKLTRLMSKLAKPAYDISIKVASDLASETAKKTFGMK